MIANIEDGGIPLTDAPNVVDLKREFRALDAQEEALKHGAEACAASLHHELARVRARKAEIAREIFVGTAS